LELWPIKGFFAELTGTATMNRTKSLYAQLLEKYVDDGVMDYKGFKNDKAKLDKYLKVMERDPHKSAPTLRSVSPYI